MSFIIKCNCPFQCDWSQQRHDVANLNCAHYPATHVVPQLTGELLSRIQVSELCGECHTMALPLKANWDNCFPLSELDELSGECHTMALPLKANWDNYFPSSELDSELSGECYTMALTLKANWANCKTAPRHMFALTYTQAMCSLLNVHMGDLAFLRFQIVFADWHGKPWN